MQKAAVFPTLTNVQVARLAGVLYLVIIVCGISSEAWVRGTLVALDNPELTVNRIAANLALYRLGLLLDIVMVLSDLLLAVALYQLFRPIHAGLALLAMVARFIQAAVIAVSITNLTAPLFVIEHAAVESGVGTPVQALLVSNYLSLHALGYDIGLLFFAVSCFATACLLSIAPLQQRWLAALLLAAGVDYLVGTLIRLIAPHWSSAFLPFYGIPVVAELAFCLWLLVARAFAKPV